MFFTGSAMSKCEPFMSSMVASWRFCIQSLNASSPSIARFGSLSKISTASLIDDPDLIRSAAFLISDCTQRSCSQPHS